MCAKEEKAPADHTMHFAAHCTARTTTCLKDVTNGGTAAAARIAGVVNWCLRKCSSENTHAASAPAHRPAQSSGPAHTAVTLSLLRLPRCRSPKMTNKSTKSETIKAFLPPPHEQVKGFLSKCTVVKVDLLQDRHIYCLQAWMCALFSPEFYRLSRKMHHRILFSSYCHANILPNTQDTEHATTKAG